MFVSFKMLWPQLYGINPKPKLYPDLWCPFRQENTMFPSIVVYNKNQNSKLEYQNSVQKSIKYLAIPSTHS